MVLCSIAFGRLNGGDTIGNQRTLTQMGKALDSFNVLSGTILHDLLHIVSQGASKTHLSFFMVLPPC